MKPSARPMSNVGATYRCSLVCLKRSDRNDQLLCEVEQTVERAAALRPHTATARCCAACQIGNASFRTAWPFGVRCRPRPRRPAGGSMVMWPSASRRFRLRDSVDFSMSSSWPISTAVMPSCCGELGQQRELAGGDAERAHGVVIDPRDDARELAHARSRQSAAVEAAISVMSAAATVPIERIGHDVHGAAPRCARGDTTVSLEMPRFEGGGQQRAGARSCVVRRTMV